MAANPRLDPGIGRGRVVTRTFRRLDPERQQAIVYAILDVTIEKGPALLNIKKVAGRAGVAVGSLYQYFGSREGLMSFYDRVVCAPADLIIYAIQAFSGFHAPARRFIGLSGRGR